MIGSLRYEPGSAHLAFGARGGVLTADAALAERLWPSISRGAPLGILVEEALRDGLAPLPDLVMFEVDGDAIRLVVRGKLAAVVRDAQGRTERFDGTAVRTWSERAFADQVALMVGEPVGPGLPLTAGVVLASGFGWVRIAPGEEGSSGESSAAESMAGESTAAESPAAENPAPRSPGPESTTNQGTPDLGTAAAGIGPQAPAASEPSRDLPDTRIAPVDDSFEHLFEETVMRSVEDAAVRMPEEDLAPSAAPGADDAAPVGNQAPTGGGAHRPGDHDGSTILAGQLAALLSSTGDPPAPAVPVVPALSVIDRSPVLLLSTGQSVALDRGVVIGRRPQIDRVAGSEIPHLVTVPSPQQDISRSHLAIRPHGSGCVAVDLGSTNGSVIHRADGGSAVLQNGATLPLQPGDLVDLGDGITVVLEVPS